MKRAFFLLGAFFIANTFGAPVPDQYHSGWIDFNKNGTEDIYEDPAQPVEKRVEDLLRQMTLEEKIGQLLQTTRDVGTEKIYKDRIEQGGMGSFFGGSEIIESPTQRNALQHIAVEGSRLGIPLIFGHDSIHGFRTIFPIPLGEASAWEPELFERTQRISARETSAAGNDWAFAPMVDLARDPRWGRTAEGFGEDPYLGCLYAAANVRGFQGTNCAAPDRVVACMKHYVGYGAAEGGRDYNTTEISEYTLRNFYLPQFKAGVDAGAWTIMSSFNCLSGFPASANRHTLNDILRDEWKFKGMVVSDYQAVVQLIDHGVAADEEEAARLAITAGVDMEMVSSNYDTLPTQIQEGKISQATVDEAVRRILRVKFIKGLFDRPYTDDNLYKGAYLKPDAVALAREAAAKSCVLLKNENGALPISKSVKKIALIGPLADAAGEMLGCWASRGRPEDAVSLAAGIRAKLSERAKLTISPGCNITNATADIKRAVKDAKAADVVILALGEPKDWSGESKSRTKLGVPGRQLELFRAVAATGKPVIVVLFNGRPLTIPEISTNAAAILEAWHPGVQGGNGVADVLFGDTDPAGRLTISFPYDVGQVPIYYNHFNTGRPGIGEYKGNYVDAPISPLYPFGYGLTYTTFQYGPVQLSATTTPLGGTLTAHAQITNTGARAGAEVVQLYIRDVAASAGPRPVRELKGFQKIRLEAGESRDVTFSISNHELGYYDTAGHWLVEPGKFQVWISKDSASGKPVDFQLEQTEMKTNQ
ncbi:MAG TPA: glycoside hydrolase family 3 N-terminal domain-containing protein [Verrucomicrobiae bacterium]|jgi:beta-glucosidase|nr:glycoside hydrolase family 3 N-terminal domain-containing protein [Verrucomicrobiae bacterium]